MSTGVGVAVGECVQEWVWRWENAYRSLCGGGKMRNRSVCCGGRMRIGVGVAVGECVQELVCGVARKCTEVGVVLGECVQEWV